MQEKWTSHKSKTSNTKRQPGHTRLRKENGMDAEEENGKAVFSD
jgi:hypothetical protein